VCSSLGSCAEAAALLQQRPSWRWWRRVWTGRIERAYCFLLLSTIGLLAAEATESGALVLYSLTLEPWRTQAALLAAGADGPLRALTRSRCYASVPGQRYALPAECQCARSGTWRRALRPRIGRRISSSRQALPGGSSNARGGRQQRHCAMGPGGWPVGNLNAGCRRVVTRTCTVTGKR
jgi:hypothetical protein